MRYVIEGTWTGYSNPASSGQRRVVHCETIYTRKKDIPEVVQFCKDNHAIYYTDGTALILNVRELKPREKPPKTNNQYGPLIRDCMAQGTCRVSELEATDGGVISRA